MGRAMSNGGTAPRFNRGRRRTACRLTKVSHSIKTALSGKDDDNTGDGGEGAAG